MTRTYNDDAIIVDVLAVSALFFYPKIIRMVCEKSYAQTLSMKEHTFDNEPTKLSSRRLLGWLDE